MSPSLRSMLEDAADDSGRPATVDLARIRAAGRRATWRRRAIVGGAGLSATAVVTAVAVVVGTAGGPGGADSYASPSQPPSSAQATAATPIGMPVLTPLLDAFSAFGYTVAAQYTDLAGVSEVDGGSDVPGGTMAMTNLPIAKDDAMGTLSVAEFSDVSMLSRPGGATDAGCAVLPDQSPDADFGWTSCDKTEHDDAEVWRASGSGAGGDGFGVTVVRPDGSGISIAMTEALYGTYASNSSDDEQSSAGGATPALDQLPLSEDTFTELVMLVASSVGSIFVSELPTAAPEVDSGSDSPCVGDVIAEVSDEFGRTELLDGQGQQMVCSFDLESDFPVAFEYVSLLTPFDPPLAAWQFGSGLVTFCGGTGVCTEGMLTAVGLVPDGVARITFEPFNGSVTEATIVDGIYFARVAPSVFETGVLAPTIVRVYNAAGALLLEGDATAPGGPGDDPATSSPPPTAEP